MISIQAPKIILGHPPKEYINTLVEEELRYIT